MFGVLVAGRPLLTEFTTISPIQAQLIIPSSPPFGHLAIFLLPGATLPLDQSAAVYIRIPPSTDFKLWGEISNAKPSAIFKIRDRKGTSGLNGIGIIDEDSMIDEDQPIPPTSGILPQSPDTNAVVIGISIEPTIQVTTALAAQKAASAIPPTSGTELVRHVPSLASTTPGAVSQVSTKVLAQRIIANAFNFLASYASSSSSSSGPEGGREVVPLKSFEEWWRKFERKVEMDPTFLEREVV